jgi:beta-glucosidase
LWGTAISAYQSEGNNFNPNWHFYEQEEQKKPESERRIIDPCGKSIDHWNRYQEDFDPAKKIGIQIHRFSIEWSRVYPKADMVDAEALKRYQKMIKALKKRNIKVMLCLNHFTIPKWFHDMGGYENEKALLLHFKEFVETAAGALGDSFDYWITINEHIVVPALSFSIGMHPPFKKDQSLFLK